MKIFRYLDGHTARWGVSDGSRSFALPDGDEGPQWVVAALRGSPEKPAGNEIQMPATVLPPLLGTAGVYCFGLNYADHVQQTKHEVPEHPRLFLRNHASLVGHGQEMLAPRVSTLFDYEGEIAVVIGREGRHIAESAALDHIGALTCFNDGSVRDYTKHATGAGKNFDRSGACGPWLATRDEWKDTSALTLRTRLNGREMQSTNTSLMIHSIAMTIAYLSGIVHLRTGDIIATGTPGGTGNRQVPQLFMKAGDRVEVDISGVGILSNPIGQGD